MMQSVQKLVNDHGCSAENSEVSRDLQVPLLTLAQVLAPSWGPS